MVDVTPERDQRFVGQRHDGYPLQSAAFRPGIVTRVELPDGAPLLAKRAGVLQDLGKKLISARAAIEVYGPGPNLLPLG